MIYVRATNVAGPLYILLRDELVAHRVNLVGRRIELNGRLRVLRMQLDAIERAIEDTEDIERCLQRAADTRYAELRDK